MAVMEIAAQNRNIKEQKNKVIRRKGLIPAVVFSKKSSRGEKDVVTFSVNAKDFSKVYSEAGESALVTVKLEGNGEFKALISEVQYEPISLEPIHVSFHEVDLTEKISAEIPVEVINEDACQAVKSGLGIIITVLSEIEVEALPENLPQHFEVDVSQLKEVGDVLTIEQAIKVDTSKVEILAGMDEVVIKLDFAEQQEIVEEEGPVTVDEVEVTEKGKTDADADSEPEAAGKDKSDS